MRNRIGAMKKRGMLLSVLLALMGMMGILGGCQLALPDEGVQTAVDGVQQDRLVGVFVTREHLELFDWDAYLQDHSGEILSDGEHVTGEGTAYEGRLYAKLVTETLADDSGTYHEHQEYVFEDLEGMGLYSAYIHSEEEGYHTSISGEGIHDVHVGYHTKDTTGEDISLEGVIYVSAASQSVQQGDTVFYFNPVYQSADGQVYLMSGSGLGSTSVSSAGASMSHNMHETVTVTVDGKEMTYGCDVTVEVRTVFAPEKVVVLQMSAENAALKQEVYVPGQMPEKIITEAETAYLLVESWKRDGDGQWIVERSICQPEDDHLSVLYDRGDGICEEDSMTIKWGKR